MNDLIKDFAVFIVSNNRPDNIKTIKALENGNSQVPYYIVIDETDPQINIYKKIYKNKLLIFNKNDYKWVDIFSNDKPDQVKAVVYARNACYDLAKELKLKYFLLLDDDYFGIYYKWKNLKEETNITRKMFGEWRIKNLDSFYNICLRYLEETDLQTLCIAQTGDFIGGILSSFASQIYLRRKAMNTFFCKTDRRVFFKGKINEDVNMYVENGLKGNLVGTIPLLAINKEITQKSKGGLTTIYLKEGTFYKSFYTVMVAPSCVKIRDMGVIERRFHHMVKWNNCAVKILDEKYKKVKNV